MQRGLDDPDREFYHGDAPVAVYQTTGVIAPAGNYAAPEFDLPTVQVATEAGYSPGLEDIVKRIRAV